MKLKTLTRDKEKAIVEAGSQAEADLLALGFEEPEEEPAGKKGSKGKGEK